MIVLLWVKRLLKKGGIECRMILLGSPDPENPASIPEKTLHGWHAEGIVEWWGHRGDMPKVFVKSNIVVLPTTYGEGVPKVLIEAASCSRAIVATDVGDIKEVIGNTDGCYLTPFDPHALSEKIKLSFDFVRTKGRTNGRERMKVLGLDSETIAKNIIEIYKGVLQS